MEAVYQRSIILCSFNKGNSRPHHIPSTPAGHPEDEKKERVFLQLCDWLENRTDSYLQGLEELHNQMFQKSATSEDEVQCQEYEKTTTATLWGTNDICKSVWTYRCSLSAEYGIILNDKWYKERTDSVASEIMRIGIKAVAKLGSITTPVKCILLLIISHNYIQSPIFYLRATKQCVVAHAVTQGGTAGVFHLDNYTS